jgi:hypothetical protein
MSKTPVIRISPPVYFSLIGGAIFSAGAGGNADAAPVVCAGVSGWAGSGAGVVGRTPPGFDSAGVLPGVVEGDDCKGCVACAKCVLRAESCVSESPAMTSPAVTIAEASQKSFLEARFLSSGDMFFTAKLFRDVNGCWSGWFPGTPAATAPAARRRHPPRRRPAACLWRSRPAPRPARCRSCAPEFRRHRAAAPSERCRRYSP